MNKAHSHDEISITMLQLCESAIAEPLYLIFKNSVSSNTFPDVWKNAKNLSSVSLLPICRKMFEKLIFTALYSFFENHKLLNPCQSGFK